MTRGIVTSSGGGWYKLPNGKNVRGMHNVQKVMNAVSATRRTGLLAQAGIQYQGDRDVYTTAGYTQPGSETFDKYWALYSRNPVAGRIVDMPAKSTWKEPPLVFEGDTPNDTKTEFEKQWAGLVERLHLWREFEKVDRVGRVGQYSVLLIGAAGGDDRELKDPLEEVQGKAEGILYVSSYTQGFASILSYENDPMNARFGLPDTYKINLSSGVSGFKVTDAVVHWSRVIHVAEDALLDNVHGRPALQRVLNALDDLLKVTASTGEAYWQLAARILQASIDPNVDMTDAQMTAMGESLEDVVHDLRRQFVGHGVELKQLAGDPPNPNDPFEVYKALTAVGSGIPTRILYGSEQGQQASNQDERAYFGMVGERQEQHAEPNILRAFIDRLIEVGALLKPAKGYTVLWPTLFEESDATKAESNKARAETAKALTPMGGDPREIIEVDAEGTIRLIPQEAGKPPESQIVIDIGDIDEIDEE